MEEIQITEEHFEEFKEAYLECVDFFELNNYNHVFQQTEMEHAAATVQVEVDGRCVIVSLCTECPDAHYSEEAMEEWATHEALHVLLADFSDTARNPSVSEDMKNREEEALVVKLQSILRRYRG